MFKFLETLFEVIGWIRIALSPVIIGLGIGAIVYYSNPSNGRLLLGIIISLAGIVTGVVWATRIYKSKTGTTHFLSRTMAAPELDKNDDDAKHIKP